MVALIPSLRLFHLPIASCVIFDSRCSSFVRRTSESVFQAVSFGSAVGLSNVEGPGWGRDSNKLVCGKLVKRCPLVLYVYVSVARKCTSIVDTLLHGVLGWKLAFD